MDDNGIITVLEELMKQNNTDYILSIVFERAIEAIKKDNEN